MNLELFLYENSKNSIKSEVPPEEVKKKATVHLSLPLSLSHLMTQMIILYQSLRNSEIVLPNLHVWKHTALIIFLSYVSICFQFLFYKN